MHELQIQRNRFYNEYEFPGIVDVLDCTHVAIFPLYSDQHPEHVYVNRKGYHSIDVQLICDQELKIININLRFPGSCHDAYIWHQSNISDTMEAIYRRDNENVFIVLGDSGENIIKC